MEKRNIYKDLVCFFVAFILIVWTVQGINFLKDQRKTYSFEIQSQRELTESVTEELKKIAGLYEFTPVSSCNLTLQLEEYTMEKVITGIDLKSYPLHWKSAQEKFQRGTAPVLFFGSEAFLGFADMNGNGPGKSQIKEWSRRFQELEVKLIQESGQEIKGKIAGILEEPSAGIYIEAGQLQALYNNSVKITGGVVKIQGKQNMEKARKILEEGGFLIE